MHPEKTERMTYQLNINKILLMEDVTIVTHGLEMICQFKTIFTIYFFLQKIIGQLLQEFYDQKY